MSNIAYQKGTFHSFRATTKIHLGSLEKDIYKDDTIEFDGFTLKIGTEEYSLPSLKSGIKMGWFVVASDSTTTYRPQSSGVKVRPANTDQEGDQSNFKVQPTVVVDDQKVVSTLNSATIGQRDGKLVESQEGQSVGKIKTSAKQKTVITDSSSVDREISRLSTTPPPKADLLPRVGEELEDVLPEASVPPKPKKVSSPDLSKIISLDKEDGTQIKWDMNVQWRRRAKIAVDKYADDAKVIDGIKEIETPGVVKLIEKKMQ